MRVKANSSFTYFYDMVPYQAAAGEEFDGLAARHLLATNADVTSLDEEPAAESEQAAAVDGLDISAKISDVLAWVGSDEDRAVEAHAAEEAKGDKARPRLLAQLEAIAAGSPVAVDDTAELDEGNDEAVSTED
jgi:hypothetical protein